MLDRDIEDTRDPDEYNHVCYECGCTMNFDEITGEWYCPICEADDE